MGINYPVWWTMSEGTMGTENELRPSNYTEKVLWGLHYLNIHM